MAKTEPCEWCGKGHYSEQARHNCLVRYEKTKCTCPQIARDRGWMHSKRYGCPKAEEGV